MRLVFAGTPEFAAQALGALLDAGHQVSLVLTQPDRRAGRGLQPSPSAVKKLSLARRLDVFQPERLREPGVSERIAAAQPEALVVAAYGMILPAGLLAAAVHGAINIHASLLPRWRGAAPIQHALLAGDAQTGISIMQMDAGLDTGPVIAQRALPIGAEDDAASLHDRLASLGAQMVVNALADLQAGRARPQPQSADGVTYAAKLTDSDARLDWKASAEALERAVRALRPTPGARTALDGETLKIWRARVVQGAGAPGEVLQSAPASLRVACGSGALEILELQRAGGRRLAAADFLRGTQLAPGKRLAS